MFDFTDKAKIRTAVTQLSSSNATTRKKAAVVLRKMAEDNQVNQNAIREAEGIPPLIRLLSDGDTAVRQKAVRVLPWLASNNVNQNAIHEAGGIMPLIRLLSDSESTVRESAATALTWVAGNETNQQVIREAGGITPLIRLLSDSESTVRGAAVKVLVWVVSNETNQQAIREAGGIMPLIQLLSDSESTVRENAAKALTWLAHNNMNQDAIRETGGITPLIRLLSDSEPTVRENAANALDWIAHNETNQQAIREAGGIMPLIRLLSDSEPAVRGSVASALANLAKENEINQKCICENNGVALLLPLLAESDSDNKRSVVRALSHLTANDAHRDKIREAGGIILLVERLTDKFYIRRSNSIKALYYLVVNHPANQAALREAQGLPILEQLAQSDENATIRIWAEKVINACPSAVNEIQERWAKERQATAKRVQEEHLQKEQEASIQKEIARLALERQLKEEQAARERVLQAKKITPPTPPSVSFKSSECDTEVSFAVISAAGTIPFADLKLQRELGRGGFGVVCEALWQEATQVAVKQLFGQLTPDLIEEFQRETSVHTRLRHPNIIALYGICVESMKYAMVMEFMANGSLYDVLKAPAELPWSLRLGMALDLSSGLLYLHGQHIIHRDLKSLNILIDDRMRAKIADFGLAKIKLTSASITKGGGGTPHWMAPELFDEATSSPATDVYATGIVLWEIAARKLPYEGKNQMQIGRFVEKGNRETVPADAPPQFATLITRCWAQRAEDRPLMNEVAREMREISGGASTGNSKTTSPTPSNVSSGYQAFSHR